MTRFILDSALAPSAGFPSFSRVDNGAPGYAAHMAELAQGYYQGVARRPQWLGIPASTRPVDTAGSGAHIHNFYPTVRRLPYQAFLTAFVFYTTDTCEEGDTVSLDLTTPEGVESILGFPCTDGFDQPPLVAEITAPFGDGLRTDFDATDQQRCHLRVTHTPNTAAAKLRILSLCWRVEAQGWLQQSIIP